MQIKKVVAVLTACLIALPTMNVSAAEDTYLSKEIQKICYEVGDRYDICPELLMAIIETESSGNQKCKTGTCVGVMQINTKYHTKRAKRLGVSLNTVRGNIITGTDLLNDLAGKYVEPDYALMAYNGGTGYANKLIKKGIYSTYYSRSILKRSEELERLHEK